MVQLPSFLHEFLIYPWYFHLRHILWFWTWWNIPFGKCICYFLKGKYSRYNKFMVQLRWYSWKNSPCPSKLSPHFLFSPENSFSNNFLTQIFALIHSSPDLLRQYIPWCYRVSSVRWFYYDYQRLSSIYFVQLYNRCSKIHYLSFSRIRNDTTHDHLKHSLNLITGHRNFSAYSKSRNKRASF